MNWHHTSDDWHVPHAENDPRAGGRFKFVLAAKDGSVRFDFGGTYSMVQVLRTMEYAIDDGRKVRVTFTSEGNVTRVEETFEAEDINSLEKQQSGWQSILDNFKKYVETHNRTGPAPCR